MRGTCPSKKTLFLVPALRIARRIGQNSLSHSNFPPTCRHGAPTRRLQEKAYDFVAWCHGVPECSISISYRAHKMSGEPNEEMPRKTRQGKPIVFDPTLHSKSGSPGGFTHGKRKAETVLVTGTPKARQPRHQRKSGSVLGEKPSGSFQGAQADMIRLAKHLQSRVDELEKRATSLQQVVIKWKETSESQNGGAAIVTRCCTAKQ
jgi:hypothetical protein